MVARELLWKETTGHMLVRLHMACRAVCSWMQIGLFATVDADAWYVGSAKL